MRYFVLCVFGLVSTPAIYAQSVWPIESGDRVRILLESRVFVEQREVTSTYQITGVVSAVTADSLVLIPRGYRDPVGAGRASVLDLEVAERRSRGRTALAYAAAGLLAAAVATELDCTFGSSEFCGFGYVVMGVPLTVGGAVLGALLPSYRWRTIHLDAGVALGAHSPVGPGVGIRLRL